MSDPRLDPRSTESPADEAAVRELLESAGRRPAVPAEDLAAIRAAARREWEALAAAERRRRFRRTLPLALAATLLLALGIGWWWSVRDAAPVGVERVATVQLVKGEVAVAPGAVLTAGTTVETGGGGLIALRLAGGESVRLDGGTRVRLTSATRLELERGAVYVDSAGAAGGGGLAIGTPWGSVREVGTQFEVRMDPAGGVALRVRVREGSVALVRQAGPEAPVAAGGELRLGRDGRLGRGRIEPQGAVWEWVLAAAPSFEIEGATLRDYLHWVSRETAWRLQYEDESLAELASTIRLHGSIEGMPPDASVAVVLPGSGLDYRLEGGALRITRAGG
ncbi:MAG TPA: FecR domain-containing protein [Thermoanaerobaculia bacterium]|nr:FecR domain-containing protein [Thermoanaerobaculia bacterium]